MAGALRGANGAIEKTQGPQIRDVALSSGHADTRRRAAIPRSATSDVTGTGSRDRPGRAAHRENCGAEREREAPRTRGISSRHGKEGPSHGYQEKDGEEKHEWLEDL